ncbi:DUF87 domain-containing protein [Desulfovibrio sp.]|uniref:ATP-binding protein n=1 Tax=Desulfovibrio sp. TaxID=885 RepID=UPI0025B88F41|nr:DUF87 domain-containing protein [Desulfovibrio sp.]
MTSPISKISSLTIGTVENVAPDEIGVLLDIDSPRNTALNTGVPTPFPRINSFVLLPNESGAVVGIVVWLGVERSAYPKRQGLKDFGLIDLPFPLRKMSVCPIGTLFSKKKTWYLERGVQSFPSVGDPVILPTRDQTIAIVTGQGTDNRVPLGTCPIAHDAPIAVDPDKLFGRHLAVLGNTGSGKSCTLASLVRSAVESAQKSIKHPETPAGAEERPKGHVNPNTRFIIFDPNGEYATCFQDLGSGCRVFQIPPITNTKAEGFTLPAWMWNSSEWAAVAQAAPRVQKPILQTALRDLRSGSCGSLDLRTKIWGRCRMVLVFLSQFEGKGTIGWPHTNNCGSQLSAFRDDIQSYKAQLKDDDPLLQPLIGLETQLNHTITANQKKDRTFHDFSDESLSAIVNLISKVLAQYQTKMHQFCSNEDSPVIFDINSLADYLEIVANQQGNNTNQFIATMIMRIKAMLGDIRMKDVITPDKIPNLSDWLNCNVGADCGSNGPVAVIDLSLVPYEILHLVVAVSSRLILESLQRYRKLNSQNLPTVLVLEEAHTFVAKCTPHGDDIPSPADMCRGIFERIAREGRKFGLGLVLSSQRPSELSETVLSQCNSFLLHRITNDRDQDLISRLVPDSARGLLRELPSLPTRHCILLGIASKVPVLVEVKRMEDGQRPESDDPDFWKVWTNEAPRPIDWAKITKDWIGSSNDAVPPQEAK